MDCLDLRYELSDLVAAYDVDPDVVEVIVAQPDTETVLGLAAAGTRWRERSNLRNATDKTLDALILNADLLTRASGDPVLAELLKAIGAAVN